MLLTREDCSRAFLNPQQADKQCNLCCQAWLLGAIQCHTLQVFSHQSCSNHPLQGICLKWRFRILYGALGSSQFGTSFLLQRKWGS